MAGRFEIDCTREPPQMSVHTRGYTLVIVITMIFAVFTRGHDSRQHVRPMGETMTEQKVACVSHHPCPLVQVKVNRVYLHR